MDHEELKNKLSHFCSAGAMLVGIGNQLRSDDGLGPELIKRLDKKIAAHCIDAGLSPENYIGKIIKLKPQAVIFVDAVSMEDPPATIRFIESGQISEYGFSTHNMSPKLMIDTIIKETNAQVCMIGIQPLTVEFGEQISGQITKAIDTLEVIFVELLGKQ